MKKRTLVSMIAFFFVAISFASNAHIQALEKDCITAVEQLKPLVHTYDSIASHYGLAVQSVTAMAFSEVVRYGKFQDRIEASASRLFSGISNYADFSIGMFQMRTICALDLEQKIEKDSVLFEKFSELLIYSSNDPSAQRLERIDRMVNPEIQFVYLCAFYAHLEHIYEDKIFENKAEKMSFYASAYNSGPSASESKINKKKNIAFFPYGSDSEDSITLGEVANYFLKTFADDLFAMPDISTGQVTDTHNKK